jgi:hypothetical protein
MCGSKSRLFSLAVCRERNELLFSVVEEAIQPGQITLEGKIIHFSIGKMTVGLQIPAAPGLQRIPP